MHMVAPQIGEFSFILITSGVVSDIFSSFEADFLLMAIAASQFLSPLWSRCFIIWCFAYRIHDPVAQPPNQAEPEQAKKVAPNQRATHLHSVHD